MTEATYDPEDISAKAGTIRSGLDYLNFQIQQMSCHDKTPADLRDLILMAIYHTQGVLTEVQEAMEIETSNRSK